MLTDSVLPCQPVFPFIAHVLTPLARCGDTVLFLELATYHLQSMHTIGGSHNCGQVKDCFMNAANAKSQPARVESEDRFRTGLATATRTAWGFTGFICASYGVPPQLRRTAGARGKESFSQCAFQSISSAGFEAFTNSRTSRKAIGALSASTD